MKRAKVFALIAIVSALAMLIAFPVKLPESIPCAYNQPILCAEFPLNGNHLLAIVTAPETSIANWHGQIGFDMLFIIGYVGLLLVGAGHFIAHQGLRRGARSVAILGGLMDAVENFGILYAVRQPHKINDGVAAWVGSAAHTKFTLLALAVIAIGAVLISQRSKIRWLGAICVALALTGGVLQWVAPWSITLITGSIALACLAALIATWRSPQSEA